MTNTHSKEKSNVNDIPKNWPHHDPGVPYLCELCELIPRECQCPNGPWLDIDAGVAWLLAENNALTVQNEKLKEALEDILHYLDIAGGDTDPNIPDDMTDEEIADEWPVMWACQLAAKALCQTTKTIKQKQPDTRGQTND